MAPNPLSRWLNRQTAPSTTLSGPVTVAPWDAQDPNTLHNPSNNVSDTDLQNLMDDLKVDAADRDFSHIVTKYTLSPRIANLMKTYSKHSNDTLIAIRAGGTPPLTDSAEKPLDIKAKTSNVPFFTGMILDEPRLYKVDDERKPITTIEKITKELKKIPEDKYPYMPVTKTPLEILRALREKSIEIEEVTQNADKTYQITLKYVQDRGPEAFTKSNGKFIITLANPDALNIREPKYEGSYQNAQGINIQDPQEKTDQEITTQITTILPGNIPSKIQEYFQANIHTELPVSYQLGNGDIKQLQCVSKNGKPISGDIDIANISVPLNLQLPKTLDKYLYESINVLEGNEQQKTVNRSKLLRNTEKLFKQFQLDYHKQMKNLEQNIETKTKQKDRNPNNHILQQELASLEIQKRLLEESPIHKILQEQQLDYNSQKLQNTSLFKRLRYSPKTLDLAKILGSAADIEHFSSLAGVITPFEFLHNVINNKLDPEHNPFQHGSDNRTPATPEEDKPQIHFFRDHMFVTHKDAQRVKLYSNDNYFNNHYEYVNPRSNMEVWGDLVKKQLESPKHKHLVTSDTKNSYFKYLLENKYKNQLSELINYITGNTALDNNQKREALNFFKLQKNMNDEDIKKISDAINSLSPIGLLKSRLQSISRTPMWDQPSNNNLANFGVLPRTSPTSSSRVASSYSSPKAAHYKAPQNPDTDEATSSTQQPNTQASPRRISR